MKMRLGLAVGALLLAGTTGAMAATDYVSFDGYCNFFSGIVLNGDTSLGVDNLTTICGYPSNAVAVGTEAKITGLSGNWLIFSTTEQDVTNTTNTAEYYAFQLPLKTGNSWLIYETTDGATISFSNSGTYTVTHKAPKLLHGSAKLPVASLVKGQFLPPK
ncbi:MAG: hypothetical protein ABSA49_09865 [Rhizomicrobium sp.]|jgi:hypothetical protein